MDPRGDPDGPEDPATVGPPRPVSWPPDTRWTSRRMRKASLAPLGFWFVYAVLNLTVFGGADSFYWWGFLALGIVGGARSLVAYSVRSGEFGVRVRTTFRTRYYPWDRIVRFEERFGTLGLVRLPRRMLVVTTTDGRDHRFKELNSYVEDDDLIEVVQVLNAELDLAQERVDHES